MTDPVPVITVLVIALAVTLGSILWLLYQAKRQRDVRARDEQIKRAVEKWLPERKL